MNAEKLLTLLLRLMAGVLLLAIPTMFFPVSWMGQIHSWLGLGQFPEQPISIYLARSCSLLYAVHGFVMLLIAIAPRRHWSLIGPLALLHVVLGISMLLIDLSAGMPWYWTACEGGPISLGGAFLYYLWRKADGK